MPMMRRSPGLYIGSQLRLQAPFWPNSPGRHFSDALKITWGAKLSEPQLARETNLAAQRLARCTNLVAHPITRIQAIQSNLAHPSKFGGTPTRTGHQFDGAPTHTGHQFGGAPTHTGHQFSDGLASTKAALSLKVFVTILLLSSASKQYIYRR